MEECKFMQIYYSDYFFLVLLRVRVGERRGREGGRASLRDDFAVGEAGGHQIFADSWTRLYSLQDQNVGTTYENEFRAKGLPKDAAAKVCALIS